MATRRCLQKRVLKQPDEFIALLLLLNKRAHTLGPQQYAMCLTNGSNYQTGPVLLRARQR